MDYVSILRRLFWWNRQPASTSEAMTIPPWAARNSSYPPLGKYADVISAQNHYTERMEQTSESERNSYQSASTDSGLIQLEQHIVSMQASQPQPKLVLIESEKADMWQW